MNTIQSILFERALKEEGIEKKSFSHDHGIPLNFNNNQIYNFVFPKSFLIDIKKLDYNKKVDYIFLGSMTGEHRQFLKKWNKPNSVIKTPNENNFIHPSNDPYGYYPENFFNKDYFQDLANAKFTLAPGGSSGMQPKYRNQNIFLWTYRFWESCLVKSIPITNEPDSRWHDDYKFYALEDNHIYREDWAEHNFKLVKERHFIWK